MFHTKLDHSAGHLLLAVGAPGVGKGARLDELLRIADIGSVTCGEICRDEIQRRTVAGRAILRHKKATGSTFAPSDIILPKVLRKIKAERHHKKTVSLDGWARVGDQVGNAIEMISQFGFTSLGVLFFKADRKVCVQRMHDRGVRPGDDDPEKRFDDFLNITVPAINHLLGFAGQGLPIQVIHFDCEVSLKEARAQARTIKSLFKLPNR